MWQDRIGQLGTLNIGIRTQSVSVAVLPALWYVSVWLMIHAGKSGIGNLDLFWSTILVLGPFIAPILAVMLVISCSRSGFRHSGWVLFAVLTVVSQWYCILFCLS